jgi:hypothetical protein
MPDKLCMGMGLAQQQCDGGSAASLPLACEMKALKARPLYNGLLGEVERQQCWNAGGAGARYDCPVAEIGI